MAKSDQIALRRLDIAVPRRGRSAERACALALPLFEETTLLDLALNLILLECALSLEVQPALHLAIAACLGLRALPLLDRPVDELIARRAAENRTADDSRSPAFAAADHGAEDATGCRTANGA
jgi:hypothetical protein